MTTYCTVNELKESGRLDITSDGYDATLQAFVVAVSAWIDEYCNRPAGSFAVSADSTRYYGPSAVCGQVLTLDTTILSVTTLTNGDGLTLAASTYRLQPRNQPRYYQIELKSSYGWLWTDADSEVTVLGKFGYSLTPPAPIKEAAIQYVAWLFKRYQVGLQDASVNFDLGEIRYSKKIPDQVLALLQPYVDRSKML